MGQNLILNMVSISVLSNSHPRLSDYPSPSSWAIISNFILIFGIDGLILDDWGLRDTPYTLLVEKYADIFLFPYLLRYPQNDKGFTVVAFNRTVSKVDHFLENEAKGTNVIGAHSIEELCKKLKRPRKIILLVKAGPAVDDFIKQLEPFLEKGDIIIDGGNSAYNPRPVCPKSAITHTETLSLSAS